MPIPEIVKRCVFYLYQDEESANGSEPQGGTGFFAYVQTITGKKAYYAVTNRHVIERGLAPIIRVNNYEGGFSVIPLSIYDWHYHPDGADVAIASVQLDLDLYDVSALPNNMLLPKEILNTNSIMLGEDVYMVGRFVHYAGKTLNIPVVRSGIISAFPNPNELIPISGGKPQEAFLIEMRSLSGFSGSPTFHEIPIWGLSNAIKVIMETVYNVDVPFENRNALSTNFFFLIGIDAGNFPMYEQVIEQIKNEDGKVTDERKTSYRAINHTGFSIVIPAWKIEETLNLEIFKMEREKLDKEPDTKEGFARTDYGEIEVPNFMQSDFENILKRVSRKVKPSDSVAEKKETLE